MPKPKVARVGAGRIYTYADGSFLASIPRPRGQGRARKRFQSFDAARAWISANAPSIALRDPLTTAETADYREAAAILPQGASLSDAARNYAKTRAVASGAPLRPAIAQFLDAKRDAGRRLDTLRDYASALARLPDIPFADLSPSVVAAALDGLNPRRRNNVLATIRTFARWAVANRYIPSDPTAAIDKASIDWTPPKIYTPGQTTIILRVTEEVAPDLVPIFALGAFAGIRSSGALRLRPDAIDLSGGVVTVPGYADKLRRGYITPVTDALRAWLSVYPFTGWQRSRQSFYVAVDRLSEKYHLPLTRNGFRHSFASYLYARTQDVRAVASALGHLGEVETLLRSYRRLISPDLAAAYFAIRPSEHVYGRD